ncbi:hypothetical protein [Pseudomonas putida]|uniref:hypothetical protein n=1 Tax=Pseudomonas putida TaxID=303 RepID=UPI0018D76012|nr:hypothetical protein [Pseudomonas putida]MBH3352097.1 hypothetical protein [Pseudomonas putida]
MTILFRPQGAFGWFSYTTSRDTIMSLAKLRTAPYAQPLWPSAMNGIAWPSNLPLWALEFSPQTIIEVAGA